MARIKRYDYNSSMSLQEIRQLRKQILSIARKHGALRIRVFGSVAKDTASKKSDVDFLVSMNEGASCFDMSHMLHELEDLLQCNIDLVSEKGLHPLMRNEILSSAVTL